MKQRVGLIVAAVVVLVLIAGAGVFTLLKFEGGVGRPPAKPAVKEGVPADTANLPVVYFNDFTGDPGPAWTVGVTSDTPTSRPFLGPFSTEKVTFRMHDLPPHDLVRVSLELFIIDTWDGSGKFGWKPPSTDGPDFVEIDVDGGPTLMRATFSALPQESPNFLETSKVQTYPWPIPSRPARGGTGASAVNGLGYVFTFRNVNRSFPMDGTYPLTFTIPHTGDTLNVDFRGAGLNSVQDESWGITNVKVEALHAKDLPTRTDADIAKDWNTLLGTDAIAANKAFWRLVPDGDKTVAFLEKNAGGFGVDKAAFDQAFAALKAKPADESLLQPLAAMGPKVTPLLTAATAGGDRSLTSLAMKVLREIEVTPIESPSARRVAAASRLLSVINTPAAQVAQQKLAAEPILAAVKGTAAYDDEWRERFDAVYTLPPGQVLKYIAKPIDERRKFLIDYRTKEHARMRMEQPYDASKDSRLDSGFVVFTNARIGGENQYLMQLGSGYQAEDMRIGSVGLSRYLTMLRLQNSKISARPPKHVIVPPELETIDLGGDWLVRPGTSQEQLFAAMAEVIREQSGRRIELVTQKVQQDVIVARGKYEFHPDQEGDEKDVILIYSTTRQSKLNTRPQTSTVGRMLEGFSSHCGIRFIDETESTAVPLKTMLYSSYAPRHIKDPPNAMDLFLQNMTRQTSLQFTREKREFEFYTVIDKDAPATQPVEK